MKKLTLSATLIAALVALGFAFTSSNDQPASLPPIPQAVTADEVSETSAQGDMTEVERDEFRAEVRAYLLDSPEVLMEAIQVLEQRQQQDAAATDDALVAANLEEIMNDGFSYIGGNPDGDVTLVEFMDYRCGFCRRAHTDLLELLENDPDIRFVMKEFPILGEQSMLSARLAIATLHKAGPDAYHGLANFLIEFSGNLTPKTMEAVLTKQGLNAAEILAYLDDPAVSRQIADVNNLAGRLNISGTPTFVLGGEMIRGYVPLANLQEMIAYLRATQE